MTGPQAASSQPRPARKGLAVPAGPADQPGLAGQPGLAESDGASSAPPRAVPAREAGAGPAASLLPVDFPGARGPSFDPARLPRA